MDRAVCVYLDETSAVPGHGVQNRHDVELNSTVKLLNYDGNLLRNLVT